MAQVFSKTRYWFHRASAYDRGRCPKLVNPVSQTPLYFAASDETTPLFAGTAKVTLRAPYAMTITGVTADLVTAQTAGSIFTVDIKINGVSILSTKITIDNTEDTSVTAAIPPVLSSTL